MQLRKSEPKKAKIRMASQSPNQGSSQDKFLLVLILSKLR